MTRLLDTGFMETDDPVVVACVIGRSVYSDFMVGTDLKQIRWTFDLQYSGPTSVQGYDDCEYLYPILIPASVVAEVFDFSIVGGSPVQPEMAQWSDRTIALAFLAGIDKRELLHWLIKHTGGES